MSLSSTNVYTAKWFQSEMPDALAGAVRSLSERSICAAICMHLCLIFKMCLFVYDFDEHYIFVYCYIFINELKFAEGGPLCVLCKEIKDEWSKTLPNVEFRLSICCLFNDTFPRNNKMFSSRAQRHVFTTPLLT